MNTNNSSSPAETEILLLSENKEIGVAYEKSIEAYTELEKATYAALETYSNIHRGSGLKSEITTQLFEQARAIVLSFLKLDKGKSIVIFCTPRRAEQLIKQLNPESYKIVSSEDIGLSIGVRAIAVKRKALPKGIPFHTGGGTTKLISQDWVIWANAPGKFEAGTPAIINVIAFAKALLLVQKNENKVFHPLSTKPLSSSEILYHDEFDKLTGLELLDKIKDNFIGKKLLVPTKNGLQTYTNLDNSASTPTFTPVWKAFKNTWRQSLQTKKEIIQETKKICSKFLNAPLSDYDVIFTSNTTEAINLTAESFKLDFERNSEPVVLNTFLEHSANDLPWRMIPNSSLIRLSVDSEGFVDSNEVEDLLCSYNLEKKHGNKRIKLLAISSASNVLGTCNNLAEISKIAHRYNVKIFVDAAQLVAHRKVDMKASEIDYLSFSAHKVYAPFGCGVLIVKKGLLKFSSSELEHINSSGEENAAGIAALGKSMVILQKIGMDLIEREENALTKLALFRFAQIPALTLYGIKNPDSTKLDQKLGVFVFTLKGMMADKIGKELSIRNGIGVRNGCLCSHIIVKQILNVGPGLEQFQRIIQTVFPKINLPGVVRVSFGIENNEKDLENLISAINTITKNPQIPSKLESDKSPEQSKSEIKKLMDTFIKESIQKVYLNSD